MSKHSLSSGKFEIPDVYDFIPNILKPWIFILFVLIVQFSGGIYLAAASEMVGTTALMKEDILMAGYASIIGLAINFAVMFRIKFRFSTRTQLLVCGAVLIIANLICAYTDSVFVLVITCLIAGWFRMQATFACNSTIQLWLTPVRDMSIFFCYVYIVVDSAIQLSAIATVYTSFFFEWKYIHWIMIGLLAFMLLLVIIFLRPVRCPHFIPLLGIDWLGAMLWTGFMMCFTFICVYGNYYDWWQSMEIRYASFIGFACLVLNIWRATFLSHPYISIKALVNKNVIRASLVYLVFFTLIATEHVFEHSYAENILGFDETNIIDLNWYVFIGIIAGAVFTYFTFALNKWSYKTLTIIAFSLAIIYLGYFYFFIDYGLEKEMLFIPLVSRGAASVIISIVYLTSILQGGLSFEEFPKALTVNGFTGAVMGTTFGPAIIGELFRHTVAKNGSLFGSAFTHTSYHISLPIGEIFDIVQRQALIVSMKEIFGLLLITAILSLLIILLWFTPIHPAASFPKWNTIRRRLRHLVKTIKKEFVIQ